MPITTDHSVAVNMKRLLWVRALLLVTLSLATGIVHGLFGLELPLLPVFTVITLLAALTLASWLRLRWQQHPLQAGELHAQLVADVVGLTALLYFTGGWTNPLVSLYLVPIAVAVIMLESPRTWTITAATLVGYSLLTLYYRPVVPLDHHHLDSFTLHVTGMWLTFFLAAGLITYFGTSMMATLRNREQALAAEREENLRNEQIIGVATLAAGTAHELSTPLASISVIASELAAEAGGTQRRQLELLLGQVAVCRETLGRLRDTASGEQASGIRPLVEFMDDLKSRLELYRPQTRLRLDFAGPTPAPRIRPGPTLQQALLNLLDNAAAVSAEPVQCRVHWDTETLDVDILDRGPGFGAEDDAARSGGMGMGLLLANATIEHLGGSVAMLPRAGGGAHVRVRLPLRSIAEAA